MTEPGRGTSATGARLTFTPASRSPRPGGARDAAHRRRRALERLPRAGPDVLHRPDVAALLVDHDERPAVTGLLQRAA